MSPTTKASAKAKLASLKVGIGYPDTWRDYLEARDRPGRRGRQRRARRAVRLPAAASTKLRARRRPRGMVAGPADGQRRQPADPERAELPGRDSRAAVLRSRRRPRRATTAPSARSSATRSATASTTRAASSTRPAASPTGGRPRTSPHFKARLGEARSRSTTPTSRFPICTRTDSSTLSENIADVAGCRRRYDAYRADRRNRTIARSSSASARAGRAKDREEVARQQVLTDGHALDEYRADTARNLDAWYARLRGQAGPAPAISRPAIACASGDRRRSLLVAAEADFQPG